MKDAFIIITPTLCQGNIPAWFEEDKPMVFDTFKEAALYLAQEHLETLERHIQEVKDGDREPDEMDLSPEDYVAACTIDEAGVIVTEDGEEIYNPETYVR